MTKIISKLSIVLMIALSASSPLTAKMQPIKKKALYGHRYYYSENDTYEHINTKKLVSWIGRLFLKKKKKVEEKQIDLTKKLEQTQTVPAKESIEPKITWIGHASFLIQVNGLNILTDPIFGDIMALNDPLFRFYKWPVKLPFQISLTKRALQPGIKLEDLPRIDAIIISHDHSDHTDADALMALAKKDNPLIFTPEGTKPLMKKFGFSRIVEKSWWQKKIIRKKGKEVTITCLPAYHWSIRFSPFSYRKSLFASWMIGTDTTHIYFAGDTTYGPHFKEIAQEFPSIDMALMPIGPTHKGENLAKHCHMDVKDAIDAFLELGALCFVPMHYGTFAWGNDHLYYPIKRFFECWKEKVAELAGKQFIFAGCGKEYAVPFSSEKEQS